MGRTNQRLINYHTSGKTAMPSGSNVHYGEIVVRHNEENPELLIKVGENSFGVFQASGAVKTAIDTAISTAKSDLNSEISALQQSLTGHVANFEAFQTEVEETYATKTELETAETNITTAYTKMVGDAKLEAIETASGYTDAQVNAAEGRLNTAIAGVESKVDTLSETVEGISTNIGDNYVSNDALTEALEQVGTDINSAKADVFASGKTYTDAEIVKAKGYTDSEITKEQNRVNTLIADVNGVIESLDDKVDGFSASSINTFATKGEVASEVSTLEGKISTAQKAATDASSGYTDDQIALAKEYSDGKLSAATETLNQTIQGVDNKVTTLSGNVHTTIANVQTALTETINNKVATAYRFQGSCTYAELASKEKVNGYVWNVTDANGNFPAGTNYAWSETDGKWDALGGSVDLSPYAKTEDVNNSFETVNQTIEELDSKVDDFSGATVAEFASLKEYADDTFATKTALQTAQENITTAYTKAIDDAKLEAIGTASGYTDAQILATKNALNQTIQNVDGRVTSLSSSTVTIQGVANSAVQTASVDCGASVNKEGTELKFSFAELIIDCGDF